MTLKSKEMLIISNLLTIFLISTTIKLISSLAISNLTNINQFKRDYYNYACELSTIYDSSQFIYDIERSNIVDGQEGLPLHLIIRLINSNTCSPLQGVYVHVWHANAFGQFSTGRTINSMKLNEYELFLRGHQITDPQGDVSFKTIIPGWISKRTNHIYVRVTLDSTSESAIYNGQLFFEEKFLELVKVSFPYSLHLKKINFITNQDDLVYNTNHQGAETTLSLAELGSGYQTIITLGVDPSKVIK